MFQVIDIALTGLTITYERETVVDFSYPFWSETQAFGVLFEESWVPLLFRALDKYVWTVYAAMAAFITAVLWSSETVNLKVKQATYSTMPVVAKSQDVFLYVIGALFYQVKW